MSQEHAIIEALINNISWIYWLTIQRWSLCRKL